METPTSMIAIYPEYGSTTSNKTGKGTSELQATLEEGSGEVGELCEGGLTEVYLYYPNGTSRPSITSLINQ